MYAKERHEPDDDITTILFVYGPQPSLFLIGTGDGRVTNEARLEGVPKAAQIVRYAPDNSLIAVSSLNSDLVSLIGPSFRQQTAINGNGFPR